MPFEVPTPAQLSQTIRQDIRAEVADVDPWIWPNNLVPVIKAFAQALHAAYLRLEFVLEQAFVNTATAEYLDYHGIQVGGLARNPAGFAQGYTEVSTNVGTVIPDGTVLVRSDGLLYQTVGTITATLPTSTVFVRAVEAGELGNLDDGGLLALQTPILGVTSSFTVIDEGLVGGTEEETDDSFRQRILTYKQNPPAGGTPSEYITWGMTMPGVTRVFPQRATPQPGSVTVYFMMDGTGTGIPTAAQVTQMQALLDELGPADAEKIAAAPVAQAIDVEVTGLLPNTAVMQEAVREEIRAMFLQRAAPAPVGSGTFVFAKAWLEEACANAPRWQRSKITVPADDVTVTTDGAIPVPGTITFV
jgi:uncharacterized phage protein gp47/JayE